MAGQKIKCVVWDLDNTVWDGILSEDGQVQLKPEIVSIIKTLDKRGILHSISSKNDWDLASKKVREFGLWEYFIYPQINWEPKSEALRTIADLINIDKNTVAFIDDQIFELEEVRFAHPEIYCIHADDVAGILEMEEFNPKFVTEDSKNRRLLYQNDIIRNEQEKTYDGSKIEFFKTLNMKFKITRAREKDLKRMEELTVRTHQLNSTGYVYSYDELKEFINNSEYELLVAQLDDKYGEYGKIGLALIHKSEGKWSIKLLLMSCRVMSRGVGSVFLNYILNQARKEKVRLLTEFILTDRNRGMFVTFKFNKFKEIEKMENNMLLEADLSEEQIIPDYIELSSEI